MKTTQLLVNIFLFASFNFKCSLAQVDETAEPPAIAVYDDAKECLLPRSNFGTVYEAGTIISGTKVAVSVGVEILLKCRDGYQVTAGSSTVTCQADGTYEPALGKCTRNPPSVTQRVQSVDGLDSCGTIAPAKVMGGESAQKGEFPWLVRLDLFYLGQKSTGRCGGALITREWVLTAAHCLKLAPVAGVQIYAGRTDFDDETETSDQQLFIGIQNVVHPEYNLGGNFNNDFALIKLNAKALITPKVRLLCLPDTLCDAASATSRVSSKYDGCVEVVAAGWGITEEGVVSQSLKKVNLTMFSRDACMQLAELQNVSDAQFCAGRSEENQDTCQGDSGGPLMCYRDKRAYALGVVSFGTADCGTANRPAVYGRNCRVLEWIRSVTGLSNDTTTTSTSPASVVRIATRPAQTLPVAAKVTTAPRRVLCGAAELSTTRNGRFSQSNGWFDVGFKMELTCSIGFQLNGANFSRCESDGTWSTPGICQPVQCRGEVLQILLRFARLVNADDATGLFAVGQRVGYACATNYLMAPGVTSNRTECLPTGEWSPPSPCYRTRTTTTTLPTTTTITMSPLLSQVPSRTSLLGFWPLNRPYALSNLVDGSSFFDDDGSALVTTRNGPFDRPGTSYTVKQNLVDGICYQAPISSPRSDTFQNGFTMAAFYYTQGPMRDQRLGDTNGAIMALNNRQREAILAVNYNGTNANSLEIWGSGGVLAMTPLLNIVKRNAWNFLAVTWSGGSFNRLRIWYANNTGLANGQFTNLRRIGGTNNYLVPTSFIHEFSLGYMCGKSTRPECASTATTDGIACVSLYNKELTEQELARLPQICKTIPT